MDEENKDTTVAENHAGEKIDRQLLAGVSAAKALLKKHKNPTVPYQTPLDAVRSRTQGFAHRVTGMTSGRIHHLQSRFEFWLLLILDFARIYAQILEGFPLPLDLTEAAARRLGFKHHYDWRKRKSAVVTVDFLAMDHEGVWHAFDFKQKHRLESARVREKLEIAKVALAELGIIHTIVSEADLDRQAVANYEFLHRLGTPFADMPIPAESFDDAAAGMHRALATKGITIRQAATCCSAQTGVGVGRLIRFALWLIARGRWSVDMSKPISADHPINFL